MVLTLIRSDKVTESITSRGPQEAVARPHGSGSQRQLWTWTQSWTTPRDVLFPMVLLPRRVPQRRDTSSPNAPGDLTQLGGFGRLCWLPWAFFNTQRAEGEAQLQRVVGISGATVPSSGSLFSMACRPFRWTLLEEGL